MRYLTRGSRLVAPATAVALLVGVGLSTAMGNAFLPRYELPAPALAVLLGPLSLWATAAVLREHSDFSSPCFKWLLAYPLFSLVFAGVLFVGSSGWVAAASRLFATTEATVALPVIGVEAFNGRRSRCDQRVQLIYQDAVRRLCADTMIGPHMAQPGGTLVGTGLTSPLGLHLELLGPPR